MTERIRFRAILLGVFFGVCICLATPYNNLFLRATLLGGGHFPLAPFFILTFLTILVAITSRIVGKTILSGLELLVSWMLMVIVSGIPYTGLVRTFFINITAPLQYATPGNRWTEALSPLLPQELFPQNTEAVQTMYDGLKGGLQMSSVEVLANIPWHAWITPLLWWGGFIFLCYFIMICLTSLISRQWVENERVNFPLLRLPTVMTEALDAQNISSFFGNRYLIMGLCVPVFLHGMNGLSSYFPEIPQIPTLFLAGNYFPKYGIFSGYYKTLKVYIYPAFIGFAFLTSRQISLSFWVFYLLGGLLFGILEFSGLHIPSSALGTTFGPTIARVEEAQTIGAILVFFCFLVWLARFHIVETLKLAFIPGTRKHGDGPEWFSTRLAFWGLVAGATLLILWCVKFGMGVGTAVVMMTLFFVGTIVVARIVCQGGIAYLTMGTAPMDAILAMFGSKFFTGPALLLSAVTQKVLFLDMRESLMPSLVHATKVGEKVRTGGSRRWYTFGIFAVLIFGVIASFAAMLALCYKFGLREMELGWATRTSLSVYDNVQSLLESPEATKEWMLTFGIIGAVVMSALVFCYHRFYWWPIHPIGFLAVYSSAMRILWFSFFLGWLCNQLSLKYGGIELFRRIRFFFFGLILGDFLMGGVFALAGLETGIAYNVLPD